MSVGWLGEEVEPWFAQLNRACHFPDAKTGGPRVIAIRAQQQLSFTQQRRYLHCLTSLTCTATVAGPQGL